jgi:hypothetical protein
VRRLSSKYKSSRKSKDPVEKHRYVGEKKCEEFWLTQICSSTETLRNLPGEFVLAKTKVNFASF